MKRRLTQTHAVAAALAAVCLVSFAAAAQGPTNPEPSSKPTPRTADGHPDLTGLWAAPAAPPPPATVKPGETVRVLLPVRGVNPDSKDVFKGLDRQGVAQRAADPNKPAYKPDLMAKVQEFNDKQSFFDPAFFCKPQGVPRMGTPSQIVQLPGQVIFLYGNSNLFRVIPIGGSHRKDVEESYMGDPVAHWEADTLVVDITNFNDDTWLGNDGYFHSESMRVVERLRRDGDTLTYTATVEDPEVLTKPWTSNPRTMKLSTNPADMLVESPPCVEHDASHLVTFEHH